MTTERTQANHRPFARQWYLAGKHLGRALVATLVTMCRGLRTVAHFALVPDWRVSGRRQRSPLSKASAKLAHAAVDATLVVLPVGVAIGYLW